MKRYYDQGSFHTRKHLIGACPQFHSLSPLLSQKSDSTRDAIARVEGYILIFRQREGGEGGRESKRERERETKNLREKESMSMLLSVGSYNRL